MSITVKPHLTTSNIYVRQEILKNNIASIDAFLNARRGHPLTMRRHADICAVRREQIKFQNANNKLISESISLSFPFGG